MVLESLAMFRSRTARNFTDIKAGAAPHAGSRFGRWEQHAQVTRRLSYASLTSSTEASSSRVATSPRGLLSATALISLLIIFPLLVLGSLLTKKTWEGSAIGLKLDLTHRLTSALSSSEGV